MNIGSFKSPSPQMGNVINSIRQKMQMVYHNVKSVVLYAKDGVGELSHALCQGQAVPVTELVPMVCSNFNVAIHTISAHVENELEFKPAPGQRLSFLAYQEVKAKKDSGKPLTTQELYIYNRMTNTPVRWPNGHHRSVNSSSLGFGISKGDVQWGSIPAEDVLLDMEPEYSPGQHPSPEFWVEDENGSMTFFDVIERKEKKFSPAVFPAFLYKDLSYHQVQLKNPELRGINIHQVFNNLEEMYPNMKIYATSNGILRMQENPEELCPIGELENHQLRVVSVERMEQLDSEAIKAVLQLSGRGFGDISL